MPAEIQTQLLLTNEKKYWPQNKLEKVALGIWCVPRKEDLLFHGQKITLLPSPWEETKNLLEATEYIDNLYEKAILVLSSKLNEIHGKNHNTLYWQTLIGPWLFLYLSILHDHYVHLKKAMELYPDFQTTGISQTDYHITSCYGEFSEISKLDSFNLQIFSSILDYLNIPFTKLSDLEKKTAPVKKRFKDVLKKMLANSINKLLNIRSKVTLANSYFDKKTLLHFFIKSRGRISFLKLGANFNHYPTQADYPTRNLLKSINIGNEEFEKMAVALISLYIPYEHIENYQQIDHLSTKFFPQNLKAIFTSNGIYTDKYFKHWAAKQHSNGAQLLLTPHGTRGFAVKYAFDPDLHDQKIADCYYSWGFEASNRNNIKAMPATKLVGQKAYDKNNTSSKILYTITIEPRYLLRYPISPLFIEKYLNNQLIFLENISPTWQEKLVIRPHREDCGWDVCARLNQRFPNLNFESWNLDFEESLLSCRIYICDHFSTTISQALINNIPSIYFWGDEVIESEYAKPYFNLLRAEKILHDSPLSAANHLNQVQGNIEEWWESGPVQTARKEFCYHLCRTSKNAANEWYKELISYTKDK
jgi:putative transferase (TIGR04331 family)